MEIGRIQTICRDEENYLIIKFPELIAPDQCAIRRAGIVFRKATFSMIEIQIIIGE